MPAGSRLSAIAALWLADVDGGELAAGTTRLCRFAVHAYVLPGLGELRLREDTVPAIAPLLASIHTDHGPAAAKSTSSVLFGILGLAVRHGLLLTNPVRETPARRGPRDSRRRPRALTLAEAHQLRARLADDPTALRQDLPDLVAFLLGTGLRIGEACAVRPTDLDLKEGTLTVAGTVTRDPLLGLLIQERPKTDAGRRTIALPPPAPRPRQPSSKASDLPGPALPATSCGPAACSPALPPRPPSAAPADLDGRRSAGSSAPGRTVVDDGFVMRPRDNLSQKGGRTGS